MPERRHGKRYDRNVSRNPAHQHDTDDDRRHRKAKRTRSDHVIMGATPFTERILKAKIPKGFDKPTDMKYDGTKDPQEHLTAFKAKMNLEGAADAVRGRAFPIADRGIIPKARQLRERTGGNKTLYCDYHRGYGHRTQDCFDLKDALKQVIRDGKPSEFAKIIKEPKRVEKDRSPEREGCNLRTQKQPPRESPEDDPAIVVNVITGKDVSGKSRSTLKKDLKVLAVRDQAPATTADKTITFLPEDCQHSTSAEDSPFVISARIGTGLVQRILVDTGADSNILFRGAYDKLGLRNENLQTHHNGVTGLGDNFLKPDGSIILPLTIGTGSQRKTILSEFVVLKNSTTYNVIFVRKTINDLSAVIFTKYLLMKFMAEDGSVETIHGDRKTAVEYDNISLALRKRSRDAAGIFLFRSRGTPKSTHNHGRKRQRSKVGPCRQGQEYSTPT
ncbi:uncharacterized protein [Arachis hypogaea]|uniref:uncharacterized protein n=1 Tax=Arachis hypogaea TaxID=3818 RepID=UPI000DEE038C|nr:uncharacterized protein LOC112778318 [Arachis hypogaea]